MALTSREDYEIIGSPLGKGGFSTAFRVRRKSDQAEFVLKEADITGLRALGADDRLVETIKREFQIMKALDHPNVVQVFNDFSEVINGRDYYYLVMQFCEDGNLQNAILDARKRSLPFDENLVLRWIRQLVSVVKYIHDKDYVHRDIKPDNIFMTNFRRDIKLGDFGIAKSQESVRQMPGSITFLSTPEYSSPEFRTERHAYCTKCDVFSLGATLHQLISLTTYPVLGHDKEFPLKVRQYYSNELRCFVQWLLTDNDSDRPSISDVAEDKLIKVIAAEVVNSNADLKGRNSNVVEVQKLAKVTTQWISTILERSTHLIAFGYGGEVIALSKMGDSVLWRSSIDTRLSGIWHAAIDEKRKRLFISYHWRFDFMNAKNVDIYSVDITDWTDASAPRHPIEATLFFRSKEWQCYSMTVLPDKDLIFICDWFHGKLGVWDLNNFGNKAGSAEPLHIISKKLLPDLKATGFRPTRCAILPSANQLSTDRPTLQIRGSLSVPEAESEESYLLAVTDWTHNYIQLLNISFSSTNSISSCQLLKTIATKGVEVGNVRGPVDIKFDIGSEVLIVCDQLNCRVQFLIPNSKWPCFRVKSISETFGHYFSAVAIQNRINNIYLHPPASGAATSRTVDELYVIAGLNTGDLVRCHLVID